MDYSERELMRALAAMRAAVLRAYRAAGEEFKAEARAQARRWRL
jgi:hypothetical protein